jgi:hypothetical protein
VFLGRPNHQFDRTLGNQFDRGVALGARTATHLQPLRDLIERNVVDTEHAPAGSL